jgi:hypothetical protein
MNKRKTLLAEFYLFVKHNRAFWLVPVIVAVVLLAGIVALAGFGGGAAAPFIYSLF